MIYMVIYNFSWFLLKYVTYNFIVLVLLLFKCDFYPGRSDLSDIVARFFEEGINTMF